MPDSDKLCSFATVFAGAKICSKLPLDSIPGLIADPRAKMEDAANFFEKGVDFLGKVRYNLFLHKGHSMPGSNFREQEV